METIMSENEKAPRGAAKAGAIIAVIMVVVAVAMFLGMTMDGAKSLREDQAGKPDPRSIPQSENDLGRAPPRN
ncbi:hypothetical protein ASE63_05720 [Bosea sp. Root381]|nr:hypothetical protein ASE63_05720 [Bosea sp. Root381]